MTSQVSQHQNVSIVDFIGAKDDEGGGDNWNYKTCRASVKSSLPTNQCATFLPAMENKKSRQKIQICDQENEK